MEILKDNALTTLERVKLKLFGDSPNVIISANVFKDDNVIANIPDSINLSVFKNGQTISGISIPSGTIIIEVDIINRTITLSNYATQTLSLTTFSISLAPIGSDNLITLLINEVTDYITLETNGRYFKERDYINEVFTIWNKWDNFILLKQNPVKSVTKLEYGSGIQTLEQWVTYPVTSWNYVDSSVEVPQGTDTVIQKTGALFVWNLPYTSSVKTIRVSYKAGYKIDFANIGDPKKHELPREISMLCEDLVIRRYRRRDAGDITSLGHTGANTVYNQDFTMEEKAVIDNYKYWSFA